ncbi:hypothetical protein O1611_g5354 [Lasiodiplodia mahajangana]|uniref:Uncharacterized protein n=1 Tax=Lasiodiplodia mahajangana TaxID=1108764 RepID=A0ACC2JLE1_9PEZI|nr:hypothetical protein O1611_g5354 [Lasiodiplodia mahajangana]
MRLDTTPFILSTSGSSQGEDPDTRKLIRRHVMLGKNRGKKFPSRRKPRRKTASTAEEARLDDSHPLVAPGKSLSRIPQQVGSDLSSMAWADSVDVSTMAVIMDFTHFTKKSMHLIEAYIDFPHKDIEWIAAFITDAAWVHMMAFTSEAILDVVRGRRMRPADQRASPHFARSMRLLRERLLGDDQMIPLTNSTVQVILALATHAKIHGEFEEARCHLMGLRRIVELRGGIHNFRPWPRLVLEILRTDIGLSIHGGTTPLFLQDPLTDPEWPYPLARFPHAIGYGHSDLLHPRCKFLESLDPDLRHAWRILTSFSSRINEATLNRGQIPRDLLIDTIASVMYSLLRMQFTQGCLNELTRLGLLAFSTGVFLQWQQGFPMGPTSFPMAFRESLCQFGDAENFPHFMIWMLLIGEFAVFSTEDKIWLHPWLRGNMKACGVRSWDDVRLILLSSPWIDIVHDNPGSGIFAEVYDTKYLREGVSEV